MKCFLINARTDPNHVSNHELYEKIKVSWLSETSHQIVECLLMFLNMRLFRWAPFFYFFLKEHYECLNTSDLWSYIFNWGSGKILTVFCKCFEKSEDGTTCCFHDRDHKDDASLAFAPRWSSLVIVFFNNTLLLLPSWWPLVTDRALEHHYLINIFNRPVCLSFLPSGHNYNSQLTRRKRA